MTTVKICGIRDEMTLIHCLDLRVEYLGFVAFPSSPRHVTAEEFNRLLAHIAAPTKSVLVTVDASNDLLDGYLDHIKGNILIQCHGDESPARLRELKQRYGCGIIKALSVSSAAEIARAEHYQDVADMLLLDAKPGGGELPGGNAKSFDWNLLKNIALPLPWMLSGGLTVQNLTQALTITHAPIVDVSSGVERIRGVKDIALINEFMNEARRNT